MYRQLLFIGASVLLLFGCGNESEEANQTELATDSVTIALPPDLVTLAPELIGSWKLEEMSYGSNIMSIADLGESTLEFTETGKMISSTPDLPPEESDFSFYNDTIRSDIDGVEQRIELLTGVQLVLVSTIDGTEIKRVYSRITP
ncbi:MAG: hypothetical protein AAF399_05130 [Bacteroidota bacterium]